MARLKRILVAGLIISASLSWGQQKQQGGQRPQQGDRQRGPSLNDGMVTRLIGQMDEDGNALVDEAELNKAFTKLEKDMKEIKDNLLKWLDENKDGKLTQQEMKPFFAAMTNYHMLRALDSNRNLALEEKELDAAFAHMARACQEYNDLLLGRFDADGDGTLSKEEAKNASEQQGRWWRRGPRQRENR